MSYTFDEYQQEIESFACYPGKNSGNLIYPLLGLCGESGELAEKIYEHLSHPYDLVARVLRLCAISGRMAEHVKKAIRDDGGELTESRYKALKELFDESVEIAGVSKGWSDAIDPNNAVLLGFESGQAIDAELGDVLWYLTRVAEERRTTLGHIARENVAKLRSRKARGKLQGSGDAR